MDAFAVLGLPRAAALDPEAVKAAYLERCRDAHPDRAGGDERLSAELNAARDLLSEPESRLKHLLELEGGAEALAWAAVPMEEDLMDLFASLGGLLARVEAWRKRHEAAGSALARALLSGEQMILQEEVERVLAGMEERKAGLLVRLPEVDEERAKDPARAAVLLRALRAQFAYLAKWQSQAREALLRLV